MAPFNVDPEKVLEFPDGDAFSRWLAAHHDGETEVWIKIHKLASGRATVTYKQAVDVALCWGWIDGIKKTFDADSYLQRFTPRRSGSLWSRINVGNVARLTAEGRMMPHGLRHVEAAKADGRWDRAYGSGATLEMPADLLAAINAVPGAGAMFSTLSAQNRFALAFRTLAMKTDAGRRKKIAALVEMLRRGETIHPQGRR